VGSVAQKAMEPFELDQELNGGHHETCFYPSIFFLWDNLAIRDLSEQIRYR
jgi:hypothetical protein